MPSDNNMDRNNNLISNHFSFFTFFKSILFFVMICVTGFILINTYHVVTHKQENVIISTEKRDNPNTLTGIHLTHHYKEQKVFSIRAKKASIKNKRIGFFRIGGLKQLELENMVVDYFVPREDASDIPSKNNNSHNESHDLISYISRASHSMPVFKQQLAGFAATHAIIRYHHPDDILTIINAHYMEISNDQKALQFKNHVAVHYQNEIILCKNLVFDVRRCQLESNDKFTHIKNGVIHKGKGFLMNLRLEAVP
jgi:hypothetical protein